MIIYTIKKILTFIFSLIYKVLALFNLQYLLLVLLVGLILLILGLFENATILLCFYIAIVLTIVLAIVLTIKKLLGIGTKKKKGVHIGDNGNNSNNQVNPTNNAPIVNQVNTQPQNVNITASRVEPIYYAIRGRKGYYMAEFSDRYELYFNKNGTLVKVRTDYKVV